MYSAKTAQLEKNNLVLKISAFRSYTILHHQMTLQTWDWKNPIQYLYHNDRQND
jgi:hypothetical protein